MNKKYLIASLLGVVCLLIIGWMFLFSNNTGEIVIINKATEYVLEGEIEVCNQQLKFKDIKQGGSVGLHYKIKSDSHYKIMVKFKSGNTLIKNLGYVTNGDDFKDTLILKDNDIELQRTR